MVNKTAPAGKKPYKGAKRGRKAFGGYYTTVAIRLDDDAQVAQITDMHPRERGAALLRGIAELAAETRARLLAEAQKQLAA